MNLTVILTDQEESLVTEMLTMSTFKNYTRDQVNKIVTSVRMLIEIAETFPDPQATLDLISEGFGLAMTPLPGERCTDPEEARM